MKQANLFALRKQRQAIQRKKADDPQEQAKIAKQPNLESAIIILSNVEKYGGEESLMVRCSRMWMERNS